MMIPFHAPDIDSDDRSALRRVLASGWLTTGAEAAGLEREFAETVGLPADQALAVSSCTAALHLACILAGWTSREQEVIVPTWTFTATAEAVWKAGATPVLADVDPESFNLSAETVARRRSRRTVGVLPVHFAGNPSGVREVIEDALGQAVPYRVVEDAAHAYPASVDGVPVGASPKTFATCFSFYPTKPITTGEGGMLTLRDPGLLARARRISLHGIDADAYQRSRKGLYHYAVVEEGEKYNMADLNAALGRSQLRKADVLAGRRLAIAERYRARLSPVTEAGLVRVPRVDDHVVSAWHLYVVRFAMDRLRSEWTRDRMAEELKERGIQTSMHYRPLHTHPYWRSRVTSSQWGEFPVADRLYASALSLPIWPGMSESQVDQVADEVCRVVKGAVR